MMIIEQPVKLFRITPVKSQTMRRPCPETNEAAFQVPLKIQHEIEASHANSPQERSQLTLPARSIKHYELVHGGVMFHKGQRRRLDRPCKCCCWEPGKEAIRQRQRTREIADRSMQDNKNLSRLKRRVSYAHDRISRTSSNDRPKNSPVLDPIYESIGATDGDFAAPTPSAARPKTA